MLKMVKSLTLVGLLLLAMVAGASAQNLLSNPCFENGLTDWITFGNVYAETSNPPQFVPFEGNGLVSMFGNWSGPWNVSGMFQEFPAAEGEAWHITSKARHWSGDPMLGVGAPNDNWVVQKIAFFDASHTEIGFAEAVILDGTFAADVWHTSPMTIGYAPAGTVSVQALILYIQPADAGGAAHIDCVELYQTGTVPSEDTTWGAIKELYN